MSRLSTAAELSAELTTSQQEVADLRNALEAAAAVHLRDVALLHDLQPKPRAGEPAAGVQRPGYATGIPAADRLDFRAAAPAYSGLAAAQPCGALPFPSDDAMCSDPSGTGHEGESSAMDEAHNNAGSAARTTEAASPAGAVEGGQARLAWSSRTPAGGRGVKAAGGGGLTADGNHSSGAVEDLGWKEKYLALFTRTLQLEFKATAWRSEHGRMLRALRCEVGGDADLEAVLAASGGDVNAAAAPWRGRAATIGLLQERLRAAQTAAGQARASPPSSPSSTTQRLSRRAPASPSAAEARRVEVESLRSELAAAQHAAAEAQAAAQKAATRRTILEAEVKGLRGHLAVLLRKAGNDDRLIAALQGALRRQPGSSSSSFHQTGQNAAATDAAPGASAEGAATHAAAGSGRGGGAGRLHSANVLRLSSISSASCGGAQETHAARAATPDAGAAEQESNGAQPTDAADPAAQHVAAAVSHAAVALGCESNEADAAMRPDAAALGDEPATAYNVSHLLAAPPSGELPPFEAAAHSTVEAAAPAGAASAAAPQAGMRDQAAVVPDTAAASADDGKLDAAGAEQLQQAEQAHAAELPSAAGQPAAVHADAELADKHQPVSGVAVAAPTAAVADAGGSSMTAAAAEQTDAAAIPEASGQAPADAAALQEAAAVTAAASSVGDVEEGEDVGLTADTNVWEHSDAAASSGASELHADSAEDNNSSQLPAAAGLQQLYDHDAEGGVEVDDVVSAAESAAELQAQLAAQAADEAAMPVEETTDEEQLGTSGRQSQGMFVAAMAAAFGQPADAIDTSSGAVTAVQPNSSEDDVDDGATATAGAESGLVGDFDDSLQLGDVGPTADAATDAAAAASAAFAAAAEAAAAAAAAAAQAAAAEVLLTASGTKDVPTPAALADAGSDVAALPLDSDTGAANPMPLQADTDDGWRAALLADSNAAQPDAAHIAGDAVGTMGSSDIAAVAERLATAVNDIEAAPGGAGQTDALADMDDGGPATASAAAAATEAAERRRAPAEAPSDEGHGVDLGLSQADTDGAADAE